MAMKVIRQGPCALWLMCVPVMVLAAPARAAVPESTIVAKVGDAVITVADMEREIHHRNLYRISPESDRRQLAEALDNLIEDRLVSEAALGIDLGGRYDVLARLRSAELSVAAKLYGAEHIAPRLRFDTVAVDSFYRSNIARYTAAEKQRHIRQLTVFHPGKGVPSTMTPYVDTLYQGWDPKRKIDSLYLRLLQGADFAALARAHSEDPMTRGTGGDMGWVSRSHLTGAMAENAFTQPLYYISRPFETAVGWHIFQVLGERPPGAVPLDDNIRSDAASQLIDIRSRQTNKQISDSLMAAGTIVVFDRALAIPDGQLGLGVPLAVANGRDTIWAADYLQDRVYWLQQNKGRAPTLEQKQDAVRSEYYKRACWYGMLRRLGYLDRPEVRQMRASLLSDEAGSVIRVQMNGAGYEPDSSSIRKYYTTHRDQFQRPPVTLEQAWQQIRNQLIADHQQRAHSEWLHRAIARYRVVRYEQRLTEIVLPHVPE